MVDFKEPDDFLDEAAQGLPTVGSYSDPKPTHHGSFYLRIGAVGNDRSIKQNPELTNCN
jgi:hypothetical protein